MGPLTRLLAGGLALVVLLAVVLGLVALNPPTITDSQSHIVGVNATTTVVETDLTVSNPLPVGIGLGNATVATGVEMNGIEMGGGTKHGLHIGAGTTNVTLTTAIDNRRIPSWWTSHVENGERTRVTTTANVTLPVVGRLPTFTNTTTVRTHVTDRLNTTASRPLNASLPLVSDPVLTVDRTTATWGAVTDGATPLETRIDLSNPNALALPITRLDYTVTMNGLTVGNGTTDGATIPAEGNRTLRTTTEIRTDRLDEWWVSHLRRGQHTDLQVSFTAVVSLPDGDTIRVPLDGLDYSTTIGTDVLSNRNRAANGSATDAKHGLAVGPKPLS